MIKTTPARIEPPSLLEMAYNGYWLCNGCRNVTRLIEVPDPTESERGATRKVCEACECPSVRFVEPIFESEKPTKI